VNINPLVPKVRDGSVCGYLRGFDPKPSAPSANHSTVQDNNNKGKDAPVTNKAQDAKGSSPSDQGPFKLDVCLTNIWLSDGQWHYVKLQRLGHDLLLSMDDGEKWKSNQTSLLSRYFETNQRRRYEKLGMFARTSLTTRVSQRNFPEAQSLVVDKQDGVSVGGIPVYDGHNLISVTNDLIESEY